MFPLDMSYNTKKIVQNITSDLFRFNVVKWVWVKFVKLRIFSTRQIYFANVKSLQCFVLLIHPLNFTRTLQLISIKYSLFCRINKIYVWFNATIRICKNEG